MTGAVSFSPRWVQQQMHHFHLDGLLVGLFVFMAYQCQLKMLFLVGIQMYNHLASYGPVFHLYEGPWARSCFSKVMSFYYRLHVLDSELQRPVLETTMNSILHVFPPLTPSTALIYRTINRVPCTLPGPASESFPICYPLKAGSLLCHLIWVWSQFVGIHCIAFWSQRDQLASFFGAIDVRFRNLKFTLKGISQATPNHWTVRNFTVHLCNTLWGTCIKPNASRLLDTLLFILVHLHDVFHVLWVWFSGGCPESPELFGKYYDGRWEHENNLENKLLISIRVCFIWIETVSHPHFWSE